MSFNKKTIRDVELKGKRVLVRADYNVPVKDGKITDDYRLRQSVPTIKYIWEQYQSSIVIMSHLGRPDGKPSSEFSLKPVAERLAQLLDKPVLFVENCVGADVAKTCKALKPGQVLLLENLRFHTEEEADDKEFAGALVKDTGAEIFVQDGFGVVHRAHASTHAVAKLLPAVAGFLVEKEVDTVTKAMEGPERPLTAVIGGAKISDKVDLLRQFIHKADCVAVVGAMANDFLLAEGDRLGKSLVEKSELATVREIIEEARELERKKVFQFILPVDAVVSTDIGGKKKTRVVDIEGHFISDVESYPKKPEYAAHNVLAEELVLDIGPMSAARIAGAVNMSRTVIWNGACGVTEAKGIAGAHPPFSHGTRLVAEAIMGKSNKHANRPFSVVGGGDTVGYVEQNGLMGHFNHVSTGGGASLELMAGKKLPGVECLQDK